jgi:hypothetical protein
MLNFAISAFPSVESLDVLEVKHVSLHKRLSDLFVCPSNEHFVVVVCPLGEASGKVDRNLGWARFDKLWQVFMGQLFFT